MPCSICQGGLYGHENWCPNSPRIEGQSAERSLYIIGALQKFATNGLPVNLDPQHPDFKTVEEANDWWKRWLHIANDTTKRIADTALSSVPAAQRELNEIS